MTAHKHYEMIVAKAANMDLVVFYRDSRSGFKVWHERKNRDKTNFNPCIDYFLCLPQHKEACLHWLSGGEVICVNVDARDGAINAYSGKWSACHYFMSKLHDMRIKPRKEKRWIAVDPSNSQPSTKLFKSKDDLDLYFGGCAGNASGYQFIEIEVEV